MRNYAMGIGVGLLTLIFIFALVPAVPVEANVPLRCDFAAHYTFEPEWTGDIWSEDGTHGILILDIIEWRDLPDVQHFSGDWSITWDDGEYLTGAQKGKVVWLTGDFVLNGKVSETSSEWTHLDGRNVHVMGYIDTTWWNSYGVFQFN